jgi:hypothetical protein
LKNGVINYYVILSDYTTDDCGSVIRGPSRPSSVSKILLEKEIAGVREIDNRIISVPSRGRAF